MSGRVTTKAKTPLNVTACCNRAKKIHHNESKVEFMLQGNIVCNTGEDLENHQFNFTKKA